mmetsp:Transcript_42562/g.40817  ORF Transcript_42562/g.40817 Transcript_42562/m.40817 type:complete len:222 (-) Transcript_42562:542-1207(-)
MAWLSLLKELCFILFFNDLLKSHIRLLLRSFRLLIKAQTFYRFHCIIINLSERSFQLVIGMKMLIHVILSCSNHPRYFFQVLPFHEIFYFSQVLQHLIQFHFMVLNFIKQLIFFILVMLLWLPPPLIIILKLLTSFIRLVPRGHERLIIFLRLYFLLFSFSASYHHYLILQSLVFLLPLLCQTLIRLIFNDLVVECPLLQNRVQILGIEGRRGTYSITPES